jgi:hypothetical protein
LAYQVNATALSLLLAAAALIQIGCSALEDHVLFITKTNIGLDIDGKPPTAEVSIARREAVLEPTFEGGQTPPVMASFRSAATGLLGVFYDISATFAGGDAATIMTKLYGDASASADKIERAAMCLSNPPSGIEMSSKGNEAGTEPYRQFVFGTDTAFGLKLAWSGITAQVPDTVRLGYSRKELAWAPLFVSKEQCMDFDKKVTKPYKLDVISFLATIDHEGGATTVKESAFDHLQYFATGRAATNLSLRQEVRKAMLRKLDPEFVPGVEYKPDKQSQCMKAWIDADKQSKLAKASQMA